MHGFLCDQLFSLSPSLSFSPFLPPPSLPLSLRAADTIDRCLSQILKYVEDVQAGKVPSNPRVGRLLMESVSRVPKIDNTRFEAMLNSTMQVLAHLPYSFDQTPRLLFISSPEFVRRLFESGDYSRAVFINASSCQRGNPYRNGELTPLI